MPLDLQGSSIHTFFLGRTLFPSAAANAESYTHIKSVHLPPTRKVQGPVGFAEQVSLWPDVD